MNKTFNRNLTKIFSLLLILTLLMTGCSDDNKTSNTSDNKDKPDTWIADREIEGLIFMSSGDASVGMNPEIAAELKKRTGITLKLQTVDAESSLQALTAGLAAGDLPDFIAYYLNNSGRPEMQILLKGAREGMFTNLTPYIKESNVYRKYLEDDFLPTDTRDNIMFRPEFEGESYLVHMTIPRNSGIEAAKAGRAYVGGPYIRKDIAEELGIEPGEITNTEQLYELAKKIDEGDFVDDNGKAITAIGPTAWGGDDRDFLYNDLVWAGPSGEKILRDENDGKIKHESQTDYGLKRIDYIHKLFDEKLLHPEFYTMEENRATEGIVNRSFGIVADMHNYLVVNNDMKYIPLGPFDTVQGEYRMQLPYKSGYAGWSIPSTTKNPEDIVKFADYLASREGKLLSHYGLEGRDYTLDENGNPLVKEEVLKLKESNFAEATKLGFRGVGAYWAEHLGYTDVDFMEDFGEVEYGTAISPESDKTAEQIRELYKYDEKLENAKVVDGMTPQSFIYEFEKGEQLKIALDNYNESLIRAYYSDTMDAAKKIMDEAAKQLENAGLSEYIEFITEKDKHDNTKLKY
ncbi:extracellular solute-binding protein [Sporosarcina sp. Marseille-Q4063]|uniref:extracellular solute-binding protein n=1 Tax=Sporosarcina sp. Marseille-Q4063 TaxID=2810514 RepID=UPI001BAF03D0|nr:extracellular solute-binding protein [Sporosarcina sp. Marseille-Q4063]QUW21509.1 extracellular solute-binding protein [Sporosarcina sp. Marseille-Q4063]